MFKDLVSLQDNTVSPKVKEYFRKTTGFHDIVGIGTGADARLYVSTVDDWPNQPPCIVEIDPNNITTTVPELLDEYEGEITGLATDGQRLIGCEGGEEGVFTLTPWDDDLDYISTDVSEWSGITVFEGIVYATRPSPNSVILRCEDTENTVLDTVVEVMKPGFSANWVGIAVCGGRLYVLSELLNLYVFDKQLQKFVWFCCLHEATKFGNSYRKMKGIGRYLYLVDRFWHLWRYDPMDPKSMTDISEKLSNISSICELDGKMYVSQISGSIYQYIPDDLTDPYSLEPEFRIPGDQLFNMCEE